jgi:hypothetical protein
MQVVEVLVPITALTVSPLEAHIKLQTVHSEVETVQVQMEQNSLIKMLLRTRAAVAVDKRGQLVIQAQAAQALSFFRTRPAHQEQSQPSLTQVQTRPTQFQPM